MRPILLKIGDITLMSYTVLLDVALLVGLYTAYRLARRYRLPHNQVLDAALQRCGAVTFAVKPELKTIYHAATVVVCNYLVALMEVGLRCFEQAGLPRETALKVIEPIVTGTVDNVFRLGPVQALTGPIARGEQAVVETQCEALARRDEQIEGIYRGLGRVAVELSAAQGNASPEALAAIEEVLGNR